MTLGDTMNESMVGDADHPMSALPGFTLRRAANAMMAELAGRLSTLDLKISDASVLLLVGSRSDMTSSDIGRLLDIQRANMVPLLNRLEGAGLIAREPIDRKSQAIVLTPEGEAKLEEVRATTARFEDDLMARIPAEHRGHFLPALNALLD
ncbi:MarR family winged helix-turn-helix transcriptional regulator [Novosphingobium rosa]|uniref:MarR family winged helix-turn-helix transcriptional regulator n=1 Tax=Novosphingobium rosa TaxID=76978 RepID=UPI001FE085D0|nr:MarR family transcriptional regulator [Novosphingobium rosa]